MPTRDYVYAHPAAAIAADGSVADPTAAAAAAAAVEPAPPHALAAEADAEVSDPPSEAVQRAVARIGMSDNDIDLRPNYRSATGTGKGCTFNVFAALCISAIAIIALVVGSVALAKVNRGTGSSAPVVGGGVQAGTGGVVTSANAQASAAGLAVLAAGGNAMDAAAAVQWALNVVEPFASGLGGGCFIVWYNNQTKTARFVDGREEAPAGYVQRVPRNADGSIDYARYMTGGAPVGVPGTLKAMDYALTQFGTWTLGQTMAQAIDIATNGFTVNALFTGRVAGDANRLLNNSLAKQLLFRPDGVTPLQPGDTLKNPQLAATFELIASSGADAFYTGAIATDVLSAINSDPHNPGAMSASDLANYRAAERVPTHTKYRGYDVYGSTYPGGGPVMAEFLNLMEGIDIGSTGQPNNLQALQYFADVENLAFADRAAYMGDADFVTVPSGLITKSYARQRRALINPIAAQSVPVPPGNPAPYTTLADEPHVPAHALHRDEMEAHEWRKSTTHFSVTDAHGNMVAVTSTLEQFFGAAIAVPNRGFFLNNELTDFDIANYTSGANGPNDPSGARMPRRTAINPEAAQTQGGKRPRSGMSPTIVVRNNQTRLTIGSPGGSRIPGGVFHVISNILDFGLSLPDAIDLPRTVSRNVVTGTDMETALFQSGIRGGLEAKGLRTNDPGGNVAAVYGVYVTDAWELIGYADQRYSQEFGVYNSAASNGVPWGH